MVERRHDGPLPAGMADTARIQRSFRRSLSTYDEHATVQRRMAERLCALLPARSYPCIAELGCGTGQLTRLLAERIPCRSYLANDLVPECAGAALRFRPQARFLPGDIDEEAPHLREHQPDGFDLVISNACLQWSRRPAATLAALHAALKPGGILAFSSFGQDNLREIRALFGVGLTSPTLDALRALLPAGTLLTLCEEHQTIVFSSLLDALRHLRATGVNAFDAPPLTHGRLKALDERFCRDFARTLTYHPRYVVLRA